jgi:phosphopantetheinyl transferase
LIYYTHILKPSDKEGFTFKDVESLFSKNSLDEFNRLTKTRKVEKFIVLKAVEKALKAVFNKENIYFEILKSKTGKPSLHVKGVKDPLFLSYSHSKKSVFLAISKETNIGVDVEEIQRLKSHRAFSKWLHQDEFIYLEKKDFKALTAIWTRKEALAKINGAGYKMSFKKTRAYPDNEIRFNKKNITLLTFERSEEIVSLAYQDDKREVLFKEII